MEALVCIAHGSNAILLRYVCVQAGYIHRHQNDIFWDYRILYEVDKICRIFEIRVL